MNVNPPQAVNCVARAAERRVEGWRARVDAHTNTRPVHAKTRRLQTLHSDVTVTQQVVVCARDEHTVEARQVEGDTYLYIVHAHIPLTSSDVTHSNRSNFGDVRMPPSSTHFATKSTYVSRHSDAATEYGGGASMSSAGAATSGVTSSWSVWFRASYSDRGGESDAELISSDLLLLQFILSRYPVHLSTKACVNKILIKTKF